MENNFYFTYFSQKMHLNFGPFLGPWAHEELIFT